MTAPKAKETKFLEKIFEQIVEKAVDAFTGPVLDYTKDFCGKASVFLGDYDKNMKKLEMGLEGLASTRESLQTTVNNQIGHLSSMKPSAKVDDWYKSAKVAAADAAELIELGKREEDKNCLGNCCFGRFLYGKKVVTCWELLCDLREKGDKLMEEDKGGLIQPGDRDLHDDLSDFKSTCRELSYAIIGLEDLKEEVINMLGQNAPGHGVKSWLKVVKSELKEGNSLTSKEEEYFEKIKKFGFGSVSDVQKEILSCTKRILKQHDQGKKHLNRLAAGPSYSSNEIAPMPA